MTIDLEVLAIVAVITVVLGLPLCRVLPRRSTRVKGGVVVAGFFLYSGFGISMTYGGSRYVLPYTLFLLAVLVGLRLGSGKQRDLDDSATEKQRGDSVAWPPRQITDTLALVFLACLAGQLLVTGNLLSLLNPVQTIVDANQGVQIFRGRLALRGNNLYTLLAYTKLLTLPFFYVALARRSAGRPWPLLTSLVLLAYAQITIESQWGRAALLRPLLVWAVFLVLHRHVRVRTAAVLGVVGGVLIIPVMVAISDWRTGVGSNSGAIAAFVQQEFSYPKYYPVAEAMGHSGGYGARMVAWIATMPIPRSLTGTSFSISQEFSEHLLGLRYAADGFYVILPSWLGEAMIGFGANLAFVWGFVIGCIIGVVDRFLATSPDFRLFDAYVIVMLAVSLRGVSQEMVAQVVNSLWLIIALAVLRGRLTAPRAQTPHRPRGATARTRRTYGY